jgi:hypothetical protein
VSKLRTLALLCVAAVSAAVSGMAFGQDGLKVPTRGEPGLDPSLASGWLSPERDRLGSRYYWRDAAGFSEGQRMQWSYNLGRNYSLGMSVANGRDFDSSPIYGAETRQYGLFGRYTLAPDWALIGEATSSRDPVNSLSRQEFRFGLRRQF